MSFIEEKFDRFAGFVRDVFQKDDDKPAKQAAVAPARSKNLAVDSTTTFDRSSKAVSAPSSGLLDQLQTQAEARSADAARANVAAAARTAAARTTAGATKRERPPHEIMSRDVAPPTGSTPLAPAPAPTVAPTSRVAPRVIDFASGQAVDSSHSTDAAAATANVQRGLDYYAQTFGREGLDGAGSGVDVLINDRTRGADGKEMFEGNGGYYSMPDAIGTVREAIHFGTGKQYHAARGLVGQASMLYADDLTIHELTHGIIRKETGHLGGEADEAGATNEGIADVMAAAATRDWRIGEGMYYADSDYKLMRNIENPDDPTAIHGLWTSMDEVNKRRAAGEEVEEHWASGVISTVGQRVQGRFEPEAGWKVVEQVFYDSINNARLGDMSFESVAAALRTSAASVYGSGSSVDQVFDEELRRAGL